MLSEGWIRITSATCEISTPSGLVFSLFRAICANTPQSSCTDLNCYILVRGTRVLRTHVLRSSSFFSVFLFSGASVPFKCFSRDWKIGVPGGDMARRLIWADINVSAWGNKCVFFMSIFSVRDEARCGFVMDRGTGVSGFARFLRWGRGEGRNGGGLGRLLCLPGQSAREVREWRLQALGSRAVDSCTCLCTICKQ